MKFALPTVLLASLTMAGALFAPVSTTSAQQSTQASAPVAGDISTFLGANRFSRELAGVMVQLATNHDEGASAGKRFSSGGWCWNADKTFYGTTPCPKEIRYREPEAKKACVNGYHKSATGNSFDCDTPKQALHRRAAVLQDFHITKTAGTELTSFLERTRMSKGTAGALEQLVAGQQGGTHPGLHKGGGWCWNDDGSFHSSLPCSK